MRCPIPKCRRLSRPARTPQCHDNLTDHLIRKIGEAATHVPPLPAFQGELEERRGILASPLLLSASAPASASIRTFQSLVVPSTPFLPIVSTQSKAKSLPGLPQLKTSGTSAKTRFAAPLEPSCEPCGQIPWKHMGH